MKIALNLSHFFHNKPADPTAPDVKAAFGNSFAPATTTPDELAAHITAGKAYTLHLFAGSRRKGDYWKSSQLLALDIDNEAGDPTLTAAYIASIPFIRDHAYLVHPSPSSTPEKPKTRVLFILSEPIIDRNRWQLYQRGIMAHFAALAPDEKCKDFARLFYGSDKPGAILLKNILTVEAAGAIAAPLIEAEARRAAEIELLRKQNPPRPIDASSSEAERITAQRLNRAIDELAATNSDRHDMLFKKAAYLFGLVKGDWPITDSDITRELKNASRANGYEAKKGEAEIDRIIRDAHAAATAITLELPSKKQRRKNRRDGQAAGTVESPAIHPARLPSFTADFTADVRYLTEIDPERLEGWGTLAIKSPTGTGKTEFTARLTKALPESASLLVLTHRVTLVKSNARRFGILDYKSFEKDDSYLVSSAPQIASTIDSLHRQAGRQFDYVFIDEFGQVLRHIASAGTTQERTIQLYEILKQIIHNAGIVIVADANLTDSAIMWLKAIRGDVYTVENTHRPERPDTIIFDNHNAAVDRAMQLVGDDKGTVLIPCASHRDARRIHRLLTRQHPGKCGEIITSWNSETKRIKEFVADINQRLPGLNWLVYTSSMGTGVDIQAAVYAVVGIYGQPLTPADAMQMQRRARNTQYSFAYAPGTVGAGETNPDTLLSRQLNAAADTSRETGAPAPDAHTAGLARLKAILDAEENHAAARYLDMFAAYLAAEGSAARMENHNPDASIKALWKETAESEADEQKTRTLDTATIPTVSREQFETLRITGQETTDEIHAGYLRWKIETASGLTISEQLYDKLHSAEQRRRLARFASLIDDESALAALDQTDAINRQPLHRRRHWKAACRLFKRIIKTAFGVETIEELKAALVNMPRSELEAKTAFIAQAHIGELKTLLGYREGHDTGADNAVGLIRWIFKRFGLELKRKQIRQGETRTYAYSIDSAELDYWLMLARARLAARQAESLSPNRQNTPLIDETVTKADPPRTVYKPLVISTAPPVKGNPFAPGWKAGAA